ncbi:esterase/lipase family protein [Peristeroidobacter agariperforans]|uniref:esterase/lipase family protein n=1 Tax=Peristeroidobacter agariperforans TaxID=268404 RepID=UPI00101DDA7B|nr:alpha/beta fold hydrolase [Peristeroidobacter agariperforans]
MTLLSIRRLWLLLTVLLAGCSFTPLADDGALEHVVVAGLEDVRFSSAHIRQGVWSPAEFSRSAHGGIFCLEPPVAGRTVVLFIHGINGSPRDFRFLIAHLDHNRFQPCVFFYASGASLDNIGRDLAKDVGELHRRYDIGSLVIVGHSIGGLIGRELVLNPSSHAGVDIPLLITMSAPWGGVPSAAVGVRWSPVVIDSWRDIASGSAYLSSLFVDAVGSTRDLPASTRHYLLFSYRKSWSSFGLSGDAVTSVASQLFRTAQDQAYRVYGFDVSHSEILRNGGVANVLDEALRTVSPQSTKAAL